MTFLSDEELIKLTARKQPAAQIRVLRRQGIAFKLDGDGHPVVAWASVNAVSGRVAKEQPGINVEALRALEANGKAKRVKA